MKRMLRRSCIYYSFFVLLFLSLTCLYSLAQASGQNDYPLTITGNNIPLREVFKAIKKQTGFAVMYNTAVTQLSQDEKVSVHFNNTPLEDVLTFLFKGRELGWKFNDDVLILYKAERTTAPTKSLGDSSITKTTLTGKVTDAGGNPVVGATVQVKGGNQGTTTDENGNFSLAKVDPNPVLVISSVGFEPREITVKGKSVLAQLNVNINELDESVIIAYGTTTKRFNTGNVSTVKAEDIEKQPVSNPLAALQGRVPGMIITQKTGMPGGGFTVQIRGQNSIANGNDPLYIIDGVPYVSQLLKNIGPLAGGNPLSFINPSDIESIDVLKDADATAIYGSRGANGVVLITTKKGKFGQTKVDFNIYYGVAEVPRKLPLLNTNQYLEMRKEAFKNDNATPQAWDYDLTLWDTTRNTDWQKTLIGGKAHYTNAQASLSGGNENTQYLLGGTFHKESTVFLDGGSNQRSSFHFNISNSSANKKFRITLTGNYSVNDYNSIMNDLTNYIGLAPNAPAIYNTDGNLNWADGTWDNPFSYLKKKFKNETNNLISNAVLSYNILPNLEIKTSAGYTSMQVSELTAEPTNSFNPTWNVKTGYSSFVNNNIKSWIIEPQINYQLKKGTSRLSALLGATIQKNTAQGQILNASGFVSDALIENVQAASRITIRSNTNTQYKYNALFGRLNYDWSKKYILNLTMRRDGSSRFGPAKQFANFYSLGAAWIFTEENFVKEGLPVVSFGKLRGSYGTSGNDQIGDYKFLDLYNSTQYPYQGTQGLTPNSLYNPELAWELNKKLEVGLELGILKDKILFTASYYRNRSSNQLLSYVLPAFSGFNSITSNLPATVQNKGIELSLNTFNVKTRDFNWSSTFSLTISRNKLLTFPNIESSSYGGPNGLIIGQPVGLIHVFNWAGVDSQTGLYQFTDFKGNKTSDPSYVTDRTALINAEPKFYGGIQNKIEYKGFQLDVFFQFVKQIGVNYYLFSPAPAGTFGYNQVSEVLNRWSGPNDMTSIQRFNQNYDTYDIFSKAQNSSQIYSDASFIRLKNIYLAYQFSDNLKEKMHLTNCRIYLQGQNLFTITRFKGLDPENQSFTSLPPLRVVTIGIQIGL